MNRRFFVEFDTEVAQGVFVKGGCAIVFNSLEDAEKAVIELQHGEHAYKNIQIKSRIPEDAPGYLRLEKEYNI